MIRVVHPGALTTVQDLGRPGLAHLGVGHSGAVDRPSLRLANRLVGNAESAAALETTFGGLVVEFEKATTISLTGARARLRLDRRAVDMFAPLWVDAGQVLELGIPEYGVRSYLAVRGGLMPPPVLGSRSTDTLAHLGPPVLEAGARLPLGHPVSSVPGIDVAPVAGPVDDVVLRALPGPRDDWFSPEALTAFQSSPYEVTPDSDRVGVRLRGPVLARTIPGELPSEGMVEGAVQVTPDRQPVLFLADHPVTGGYPVIAVVHPDDVPAAGQTRPGQQVRFRLLARR